MSETLFASLGKKNTTADAIYHPHIYNLQKTGDREQLHKLLNDHPYIQVADEIRSQLRELLKSRNPKLKLSHEDLDLLVNRHLGDSDPAHYGVWVYYPWSFRLLHILDKTEFIEVRTNRNQYKITVEERDKLGTLKIGVVGLSVGKTIAVAMAMERSYGEIRLADYDTLELTNLNRIQTGLYNLGISKAIAVAREIAEIDPFLKTICYTDGLTEENMDHFFENGGKLDILVEECDGLDIKILCRQKAKALGIPVVMDMNDRGTLDVERFDLEPNRPLLHGMIDHLDISRIKNLSNEEKVPYILPILGAETISSKLKASMIEIGQTITTWPQLASSVVLGGALAADVCRRISLDQFHDSGRYFVDLEELICDKNVPLPSVPALKETETELSQEVMETLLAKQNLIADKEQLALPEDQIRELILASTAAPSGANCQPWKWFYKDKFLYLFHDRIRSLSLMDYENTASNIALGAATENLVLKAHTFELEVATTLFMPGSGKLIAAFRFYPKHTASVKGIEPHVCDDLADTIFERATNRKYGVRQQLEKEKLDRIQQVAASMPGAALKIITSDSDLLEAADIIGCVDRIRLMNEDDHHDFIHEMRWTREEAEQSQDGIDLATIELTPSELAGFQMSVTPEVIRHLNTWKGGRAFEKMGRKAIATASAVGLLTMPEFSPTHFLNGGRGLQRAWLQANKMGLAIHPVSSPTFFFSRLIQGKGKGFNPGMKEELQQLRHRFTKLFSLSSGTGEIFLFRIHIADAIDMKALRRPVDEVLYL